MKKVYIILLNYNNCDDSLECINSLKQNIDLDKYQILVVDNKSNDDSVKKLKKVSDIILIESKENGGFSAGNNLGIRYALDHGADFVILLNNDTVITKNCFEIMLDKINSDDSIGIVGNKVLYYDDPQKINSYGGKINLRRGTAILGYEDIKDTENIPNFMYVSFVTGCCMLIRKKVFEEVGLLPEEYFMYYEDVDFCMSVNKKFKIAVCGDSVIYHKVSSSTGGKESCFSVEWNTRNRMIFMNKYKFRCSSFLFFYLTRIIVLIKYLVKGEKNKYSALIKGLKSGMKYIKER